MIIENTFKAFYPISTDTLVEVRTLAAAVVVLVVVVLEQVGMPGSHTLVVVLEQQVDMPMERIEGMAEEGMAVVGNIHRLAVLVVAVRRQAETVVGMRNMVVVLEVVPKVGMDLL